MSEPTVDLIEHRGQPAVLICYEGKAYKFARNSEGQVRCFWWEGAKDYNMFRFLNPYAVKALGSSRQEHTSHREIPMPSGPSCRHCGNLFHPGEQVTNVCPGCGENPFE